MSSPKPNHLCEYHLNKNEPDQPQFAIYSLHEYLKSNKANTTRPHIHSFYQVIWFQTGKGVHYVDLEAHEVNTNTAFFIDQNQVHYFDESLDYTGYLIHFNKSFLIQSENDFFQINHFFNDPSQKPNCQLDLETVNFLAQQVAYIMDEYNQQGHPYGQNKLLRSYIRTILIRIQRVKYQTSQADQSMVIDEKRALFLRFINHIEQNYRQGTTVAEYADLLSISTRTLADLTQQAVGKTPSKLIQERIILEAQRLLMHSDLNVNQIGYQLGFTDPSYFVKYFKKHTEQAPSTFRKHLA